MGLGGTGGESGGSEEALVTIVVGQSNDAPTEGTGRLVGQRLDRYHVLELVGTGGMGEVYRAYDTKLKREVALKLLRQASATNASLGDASTRLMREAQAMARLSHPNVLPVFDAGEHDGLTFIAMEFVEGQTISDWSKSGSREEEDVLRVYRAAGAGLAAAHDSGFVHRDFKPSNVMIGADGRVRVMDFGLVRLEHESGPTSGSPADVPDDALSTSLTLQGSVVGTPVYMSPEQHYGDGSSPKSDQYAFCVSLFKTLYGRPPFDGASLRDLVAEKEGQAPQIPKQPRTPVRETVRDTLTRGLAADPNDRWPDMRALLDALEPARRGSRRWWVAGLAVAGAATLAFVSSGASAQDPCLDTDARLEGVWTEPLAQQVQSAEGATATPQLTKTTVGVMDTWATAWAREYTDACRLQSSQKTLAASRLRCLERQRVQARAIGDRLTDTEVVAAVHAAAESLEPPSNCLDARELQLEPAQASAIAALDADLAEFKTDAFFLTTETIDERLAALEQRAADLDHAPALMRTSSAKAHAWVINGRPRPAAEAYTEAFFFAVRDRSERDAAKFAVRLTGLIGDDLEDPKLGLMWSRQAEAWLDTTDDATLGDLRLQRGRIRYRQEDFEGALSDAIEAQSLLERAHGRAHTLVESTINNQANALMRLERFEAAEEKHRQALELQQELFGIGHPKTATVWLNLGSGQAEAGKLEEAVESFRHAERIYLDVDADHPRLSRVYSNLGAVQARSGNVTAAAASFTQAVDAAAACNADATERVGPLRNLAMAQFSLKRYEAAIATLERAVSFQLQFGPRSKELTRLYAFIAMSHVALERHADAVASWRKTLRSAEEAGEPPARMTHVRTELGKAYHALGDSREARRNLEIALEIGRGTPDAMPDEQLGEITKLLEEL